MTTSSTLVAIRAAHHAEATPHYDRVVFEFSGPVPLLRLEYVKQLISDGSGVPIHVAGRSIYCAQFATAQAHDDAGHATAPNRILPKLPIIREIVSAGDFEGIVTYGIGVSKKAYTRILTMDNANRLVIDFLM